MCPKVDILGMYSVSWRKIVGFDQIQGRRRDLHLYAERTRREIPVYARTFPARQRSGSYKPL